MKVIFERQNILNATAPLMSTAANRSTMGATDGILIEAKNPDVCVFTTYDLEKGLRTTVETKVLEEGACIVNAQKFIQTMRVMDGDEVMLTVDEKMTAVFACGKSSHKMIALKAEDFPELPTLQSEYGFTVSEGILKDLLGKTMYAIGVSDQRPVLNGCYIEVEEGHLLLVACDSFKLAKCGRAVTVENNNTDGSDLRYRFILPVKTVNELYKLLSDDNEKTVRILMARRHIIFFIDDVIFFSRLIDGEYIDFDRIIIQQHKIKITLDRDAFLAALDRAALITEERVAGSVRSHVKLQIEGDLLKIMADSSAGSTYDELEIEHEGADLVIAFNNRFLIDSVRAADTERISLYLSSPLTSVNIKPVDEETCDEDVFMLLPVRMKE